MQNIQLSDEAFLAYKSRAEQLEPTVDEYLNQSAPTDSAPALTAEARAAIEKGLADADAGRLVGMLQVREALANYRATWRENKNA